MTAECVCAGHAAHVRVSVRRRLFVMCAHVASHTDRQGARPVLRPPLTAMVVVRYTRAAQTGQNKAGPRRPGHAAAGPVTDRSPRTPTVAEDNRIRAAAAAAAGSIAADVT